MQTDAQFSANESFPDPAATDAGFEFKPQNAKPVYRALAEHQTTEATWELSVVLAWLQTWSQTFIEEFSLELSEVSLCVEWLDRRCYGHFRRGHNGFGLTAEIAINRRYLHVRQPWEILGTLLHELLHAHQELHGKPGKHNYHNKQFRDMARRFGLIIDHRGATQYEPDSLFLRLLHRRGVEFPKLPPVRQRPPAPTKMKKWSCRCTRPINVRVAVADFYAKCLRCDALFRRAD